MQTHEIVVEGEVIRKLGLDQIKKQIQRCAERAMKLNRGCEVAISPDCPYRNNEPAKVRGEQMHSALLILRIQNGRLGRKTEEDVLTFQTGLELFFVLDKSF